MTNPSVLAFTLSYIAVEFKLSDKMIEIMYYKVYTLSKFFFFLMSVWIVYQETNLLS